MENLKIVSALVKKILEQDNKARNTDNNLYLKVLEHYSGLRGIDIRAMTVPVFLKELDRHSFPGFETVRRSRQKVQATYLPGTGEDLHWSNQARLLRQHFRFAYPRQRNSFLL